jgi:aryl-alcohol dehydrogenase-like predicted oxidoreductase
MKYNKLANTEIQLSEIVLGCWAFGGGYTWGDQEDELSIRTVHAALDAGLTCFDTAEFYGGGRSEDVLGRALVGRRASAVVISKLWVENMARDKVLKACEDSLKRLRMDYIDLYMIHWPNRAVPLSETLEALLSLKRAGKIRAIGVCNFGAQDLADALSLVDVAADQLPYSLLFRAIEFEVLAACRSRAVPVLAYSTLAQGLLTGKFARPEDVDDERARIRFYSRDRPGTVHEEPGYEREVFGAISRLRSVCERAGVSMTQAAVAWVLSRPGVSGVLFGARTPEQL